MWVTWRDAPPYQFGCVDYKKVWIKKEWRIFNIECVATSKCCECYTHVFHVFDEIVDIALGYFVLLFKKCNRCIRKVHWGICLATMRGTSVSQTCSIGLKRECRPLYTLYYFRFKHVPTGQTVWSLALFYANYQ